MALKKSLLLLALGLWLALGAMPGLAADEDLDLLNEMETEAKSEKKSSDSDLDLLDDMQDEKTPKKKSVLEPFVKLGTNFGGSLRLRYIRYLRGAAERDGADLDFNHYDYILKLNTSTSGKYWSFKIDGWAEGGNQANTFGGYSQWFQDTHKDTVRHAEINELYFALNFDSFDFTIGKKTFKNGLSTLFSPADRLRPQVTHDPFDPKDIGLWQARLDYYLNSYSFTGVIFPVYQAGKNWPSSSRWSGSTQNNNNRDAEHRNDSDVEEEYPQINMDSVGYFVRVKTTLSGWDVFASMYQGPNPYSVIREENRGGTTVKIKEIVRVGDYAVGFSTTYKKWEFHGETLFNWSYDSKDDNYFNYVLGFTYTIDDWAKYLFLDRIDITLEYAGEFMVYEQSATNFTDSSGKSRSGRNDIFSRVVFKVNEDLKFTYATNFEFNEDGWYNYFGVEYKFDCGLIWTVAGETFSGNEEGYYGRWWRNDRIFTVFEYKF